MELDAVKKSEDGKFLVIRFHEFAGSRQEVTAKLGVPWKSWAECDLRERPLCAFIGDEIHLELHAYEIKTILVEL